MASDSFFHPSRREVGLADLLRVLALLRPQHPDHLRAISASVGLEWCETPREAAHAFEPAPPPEAADNFPEPLPPESPGPESVRQPGFSPQSGTWLLEPIGEGENVFEKLFDAPLLEAVTPLAPTQVQIHLKAPSYQPLFKTEWFRGIMGLILSTPTASRDLDWRMLERRLSDGRPLPELPLRQRPTLKRGVSLFLDRSDSMQPFWRDEKELLNKLQRLLGPRKVQAWWLTVDSWRTGNPVKWHTPAPRQLPVETPLLIVSNFGSRGEPSGEGATALRPWQPLFNLAQTHQCPVIALIPAPEPYWPGQLKQHVRFAFAWDHDTSPQSVARQLQRHFR